MSNRHVFSVNRRECTVTVADSESSYGLTKFIYDSSCHPVNQEIIKVPPDLMRAVGTYQSERYVVGLIRGRLRKALADAGAL